MTNTKYLDLAIQIQSLSDDLTVEAAWFCV